MKPPEKSIAPALDSGMDILEMLARSQHSLGFNEIANFLPVSKSSAVRLLKALMARKYIVREELTGKYRLGAKMSIFTCGHPTVEYLRNQSGPILKSLVEKTGNTAIVIYWTGQEMLCLNKAIHEQSIPMQPIGNIVTDVALDPWGWLFYLHADKTEQQKMLDQTGDAGSFLKKLPTWQNYYKKNGFIYDNQTCYKLLRRITAPVFNQSGKITAAIGLGGNSLCMPDNKIKKMGLAVVEHARMLSEQI